MQFMYYLNGVDISMLDVCVCVCLKDLDMFDEVTDTPTIARTSNLNEELGQVSECHHNVTLLIC